MWCSSHAKTFRSFSRNNSVASEMQECEDEGARPDTLGRNHNAVGARKGEATPVARRGDSGWRTPKGDEKLQRVGRQLRAGKEEQVVADEVVLEEERRGHLQGLERAVLHRVVIGPGKCGWNARSKVAGRKVHLCGHVGRRDSRSVSGPRESASAGTDRREL